MMPQVDVVVAGFLEIGHDGEHFIESSLKTEEAVEEYGHKVEQKVVRLSEENAKCAVCMDGRGCHCLASDLVDGQLPESPDKAPVRAEMAGGLYDMATSMALLANWSGLGEVSTYADARKIVGDFLAAEGYEDGAHSSDVSYDSEETTECGAWMKKLKAMEKGASDDRSTSIDAAVGAYQGLGVDTITSDPRYSKIRQNQHSRVESGIFRTFDPITTRNEMIEEKPMSLELLRSDPNHPTHNHKEPALVINEVEDTSVDRDAIYAEDQAAPFVDDRWLRREIASVMGATEDEADLLLLAGDVVTVDVSDELVAPGMPVIVLKAA